MLLNLILINKNRIDGKIKKKPRGVSAKVKFNLQLHM